MDYEFAAFEIKRYRSIMNLKLDLNCDSPTVICGENNVGKTNVLRALDLFFNHYNDSNLFNDGLDVPYHIRYGSGGKRSNTELVGTFCCGDEKIILQVLFSKSDTDATYRINGSEVSADIAIALIKNFRYIFIKSNNVNLPSLISLVLESDALLPLDRQRAKQSEPLKVLNNFIELSKTAITDIERNLNTIFEQFSGLDNSLNGTSVKINFAEYEKLRDVVKTMTSITLFDGNNNSIDTKGSGAQRIVFITLMNYIARNCNDKVIWGIDEPEVFLQPKLQKSLFKVISETVRKYSQRVILTTHSPNFVDVSNLKSTHLLVGNRELKEYKRKPGQCFYELNTKMFQAKSSYEMAMEIKSHFGILDNDGWKVMPENVLLEGKTDFEYLKYLLLALDLPVPNLIYCGGASKISGSLQYYESYSDALGFKPAFLCVFDNDLEGRSSFDKIKINKFRKINVAKIIIPHSSGIVSKGDKVNWAIEDFLPVEQVFKCVNIILRKLKYRTITRAQINLFQGVAYNDCEILNYVNTASRSNNSEKKALNFFDDGLKMRLCEIFVSQPAVDVRLNCEQTGFLNNLIKLD